MDRRESPRVTVRLPGTLTVLGSGGGRSPEEQPWPAMVKSLSGNGASVATERPLRPGTLIKLVVNDDLFLGEVVYCGADAGGFVVGMHLDCALASLSGIRKLMSRLLQESEPLRAEPGQKTMAG